MDGLKMKYFVLNPTKNDPYGQASRQALRAYALSICDINPSLADDLRKWASDEETDKTVNNKQMRVDSLKPGEPCSHPGCCNHITHPCEYCGRIGCQ